jgi:flavin reductase (DIM6/NTAB) family NADH-FMN oxidoreductase RutF
LTPRVFSPILWVTFPSKKGEGKMHRIISNAISHGVYIITARTKEKVNGMTAAWVSQVSFKPLLLMASISPERFTHDLIKESGYFGINTLDEDLQNYAATFGFRSGRNTDKFQRVPFSDAPHGSPVLEGALAFLECKVVDIFTAGDHTLFIGEVVEAKLLKEDADPLIFHWDDYF